MKILVTGGSGFIGTYLVADLLQQGHNILIYDKQISATYPGLCVKADVRDQEKLIDAAKGKDLVIHLAAEHRDDVRPSSLYYDVNVGGAENLVPACEKNNVSRLIFTSTVALYGLNPGVPDENSHVKPFNDYGKSKYQAEKVFERWARADGRRALTIVRPTVIFGENNRGNVYNLLKQIASGRFIMVGRGENRKSMGYVCNLSRFLTLNLAQAPGIQHYNYADKPDFKTKEIVNLVFDTLPGKRKPIFRLPYAVGLAGGYAFDLLAKITGRTFPVSSIRIRKFCADTVIAADKLKEVGFEAPFTLKEGLKRMIQSEFPATVA